MQIFVGLLLSCLLLSAKSQNSFKTSVLYNGAFINQDRIYFEDERQGLLGSESVTSEAIYRPDTARDRQNIQRIYSKRDDSFVIKPSVDTVKLNGVRSNGITSGNRQPFQTKQVANIGAVQYNNEAEATSNFDNVPDAITNFGINLFKQVNELQEGNTVISPYSITMLLALLQQGATETTLQQITNALQLSTTKSAEIYRRITEDVQKRNSRNILNVANNVYVADTFNLNSDFKRIAIRNFNSEVTPIGFVRPDLAAQYINSWVASKTNNKIEKLLSSDSLSENTQLVLVNAVYFKGLWQIPFRPELTLSRPFEVRRGLTKNTSFMRTRRYFRTGVDAYTGAKIIILPFEFDQYSLMVILPSQLSSVERELSTLNVSQLASYHNFTAKDVELELPKFTVKADTDLAPVFTKMGITNIFSQRSELYGLGTYRTSSPQVSSALHSAVLSIDEQGGSAAAATAFTVVALSYDDPSVKFIVNRPFIVVLWDSGTSLPLFMAKVVDPVF